jgi:hypothetical protein
MNGWWARKPLRLLLLLAATVSYAAPVSQISWQDAVARLSRERGLAETCAAVIIKYGNKTTVDRGAIGYGEAKAEYDGLIRGLITALSQDSAPESLSDLQGQLQRAHDSLAAFCTEARKLAPAPKAGTKGDVFDMVGESIGKLVEAVATLWGKKIDVGESTKKTIQTQLEASEWPAFDKVSRLP